MAQRLIIDPDDLTTHAASDEPHRGVAQFARQVEALVERDAGLVLAVAWNGQTQAEAGAALGLSEAALSSATLPLFKKPPSWIILAWGLKVLLVCRTNMTLT